MSLVIRTLASVDFDVKNGEAYILNVKAIGDKIIISVNSETMLEYVDENPIEHGCVGYSIAGGGRMIVKDISFEEI